jgi:hypothetical protein
MQSISLVNYRSFQAEIHMLSVCWFC